MRHGGILLHLLGSPSPRSAQPLHELVLLPVAPWPQCGEMEQEVETQLTAYEPRTLGKFLEPSLRSKSKVTTYFIGLL